jgi:protein tyrosine/serine phosphatase
MSRRGNHEQDIPAMKPGLIQNAYWVAPGRILAGEYPAFGKDEISRERIRWLLASGVNSFLDLTQDGEYSLRSYLDLLRGVQDQEIRISYQRYPVADMQVPAVDGMIRILDHIENEIGNGRIVYLHCYGGRGRTGTVVGCYLVRNGMTGERALAQITRLRSAVQVPEGRLESPETDEQRQMVLSWLPGQ